MARSKRSNAEPNQIMCYTTLKKDYYQARSALSRQSLLMEFVDYLHSGEEGKVFVKDVEATEGCMYDKELDRVQVQDELMLFSELFISFLKSEIRTKKEWREYIASLQDVWSRVGETLPDNFKSNILDNYP